LAASAAQLFVVAVWCSLAMRWMTDDEVCMYLSVFSIQGSLTPPTCLLMNY
jgi:hypothetical protein